MFTLEQIDDIHDRLGRQETLVQYLRALNAIGVERSDSFIADGHSEYSGTGGETVVTPPAHEVLTVAEASSRDGLVEHLARHSQGQTSYLEMSKGLAESGVEKWSFDTSALTIAYYDKAGNELLRHELHAQPQAQRFGEPFQHGDRGHGAAGFEPGD